MSYGLKSNMVTFSDNKEREISVGDTLYIGPFSGKEKNKALLVTKMGKDFFRCGEYQFYVDGAQIANADSSYSDKALSAFPEQGDCERIIKIKNLYEFMSGWRKEQEWMPWTKEQLSQIEEVLGLNLLKEQ